MGCGIGGCTECMVEFDPPDGPAMKRVCMNEPVFEANAIFG